MSLTRRVLLALVAGLTCGVAVALWGSPALREWITWIEPIGTLWTRGLQMTVIPLVVTLLFNGVIGGGRGIGETGVRGIGLFIVLLFAAAMLTVTLGPILFSRLSVDPSSATTLRAAVTTPPGEIPGFRDWLVSLVPSNLIAAGSNGLMLPIIVATLLFAAAAAKLPDAHRDQLEAVTTAVGAMTLIVVRWMMSLAPIGVFALSLPLAARLGVATLGAVVAYVVVNAILTTLVIGAMYPLVALRGFGLKEFARATAPAQGIAMSARSSLAAIPAMINGATALGLPPRITGFFVPFSASLFRLGAGIALPTGAMFIARLYGVTLSTSDYIAIVLTAVPLSFSVPGIPGGSVLIMAPVLLAAGIPAEGLGILLGVDTIPDMFRTTTNVTGSMAASALMGSAARPKGPTKPP